MLILLLQAIYFVLPAYLANMMPVFFAKLQLLECLNRPIDYNFKIGSRELFGRNKTWRGLVAGTSGGVLMAMFQAGAYHWPYFHNLSLFNYSEYWLAFGILAGAGALLGDLAKSFFKRRLNIKPGGVWPIFDQLDFIVGFFIFTSFIVWPGWSVFLTVCLLTLILHPLTNIIGYILGIKRVWW